MFSFEHRWIEAVFAGFAPPGKSEDPSRLTPREGEVDHVASFRKMQGACTERAKLGFRIALWMAALAPFWMTFRFKTMTGLRADERAKILDRMLEHRLFFVRELTMLLKVGASFALIGTPSVRARTGYDATPPAHVDPPAGASPTVEKKARSLKVLHPVDVEGV